MARRRLAWLALLCAGRAGLAAPRPTKHPAPPFAQDPRRRLQRPNDIVCKNLAGWTDSGGLQCFHYASNGWCTSAGRAGPNWERAWGNVEDYASDGSSAYDACCACGGGSESEGCSGSLNSWTDSEGQSCEAYEQNHWCTAAGDVGVAWVASWGPLADFASNGKTPQDACCACGGGQDGICRDFPDGWKDTDDDTCAHYEKRSYCTPLGEAGSRWDEEWGSLTQYSTGGVSALTACCVCGGGCYDDPHGWVDIYGASCADYAANAWCSSAGSQGSGWQEAWGSVEQYGRSGRNALTACCECGGGSTKSPSLPDKPVCKDKVPGWRDTEGDDCNSYAVHRWCSASGTEDVGWPSQWGKIDDFANDGHSAFSACCGCGSGCSDTVLDWVDTDGDSCASYEANQYCTAEGKAGVGWNISWGAIAEYSTNGVSALTVCCACGGGTSYEQPLPVIPVPGQPVCTDRESGWADSSARSCSDYAAAQLCTAGAWSGAAQDAAALSVCCSCGGGCVDTVQGWSDSYGAGCAAYAENQWCTKSGEPGSGWKADWGDIAGYGDEGYTALWACCACGGGVSLKDYVPPPTTTTTLAPAAPVTGRLGLYAEAPQKFLLDGADKVAMEGFVTETLAEVLSLSSGAITVTIVAARRLSSGVKLRTGQNRRLANFGTVTAAYALLLEGGLDEAAAAARRAELRAAVGAVTPAAAGAILAAKVAGAYSVTVLTIAADAEGAVVEEDSAEKLSDKGGGNGKDKAGSYVGAAVIGLLLVSCCLGGVCVRFFMRSCKAKRRSSLVHDDGANLPALQGDDAASPPATRAEDDNTSEHAL